MNDSELMFVSQEKSEERFTLGDRLREERDRLRLSQKDVAEKLATTTRTIIKWEANITSPTARDLAKLHDDGFNVYYIVTGKKMAMEEINDKFGDAMTPARRVASEIAGMALSEEDAEALLAVARRFSSKK